MRGASTRDKVRLRFRQIDSCENEHYSRFVALAETVFDMEPAPAWPVAAFVDVSGRCVAGLQHCHLKLSCDGAPFPVLAIRNVAVASDWRRQGLMHDLVERTLLACDARASATLLYTETPKLYTRLGFTPLPQHSFEAAAPNPLGARTARLLDEQTARAVTSNLFSSRTPASSLCGVLDDRGMAERKIREGLWPVAYDPTLDALIVYETEEETLVLVDVVATHIPSAACILGALGAWPERLRTLFVPDKLGWVGEAVPEDAGLMIRGTPPPAMRRPFILPPTFEF